MNSSRAVVRKEGVGGMTNESRKHASEMVHRIWECLSIK
jgi:hypothetical protein